MNAPSQTSAQARTDSLADHPVEEVAAPPSSRERGVTLRVVVLCLALAVVLGYALPVIDYKIFNTFLGATHLPPGAIGVVLVLVLLVNPLLRLLSKRLAFSRNEVLTVYITCLFSSLVPGHGAENFIIPNLLAPFYLATRDNKWFDFLLPYTPTWMTPALTADRQYARDIVQPWYVGLSPGQSIPWEAWIVPLAAWFALTLASYAMLGCLSVMLRAQWSEHEALSFPLLRLPQVLTEDLDRDDKYGMLGRFFRNPMMWAGFAIAVAFQGLRGLHVYYPDVPNIPNEISTGPLFTEPPWNQLGWVPMVVYPLVIGVTFLLTTEVAFSLWFFFWFIKLQYLGAYFLGFMPNSLPWASGIYGDRVFTGFQQGGAFMAYVAIVLWTGREHLRHIVRRAFGREKARPGEHREVMSYPTAFWGFVAAFLFMVGWSIFAGVRVDIAVALWVSYLVYAIGLTRVVVEGGSVMILHDAAPLGAIARLLSPVAPNWLNHQAGLMPASYMQAGLVVHMRGFSMPSFVQAFKLGYDHKIAPRPMLALLVAVIVIALGVSFITVVRLGYETSGLQLGHKWFAQQGSLWPANFVKNLLEIQNISPVTGWISTGVGAALTYGMMLARSRFPGFPFHPVGYLICMTYPGRIFWFSVFLGWLCKVLITRFGGHETYRRTQPMFLGLAFGDVAMILLWLAIDGWQGRTGHQLLPG